MTKPYADENTIKKINDLLTKAGHPNTNEHEARTSAITAAKYIYKYNLKLVNADNSIIDNTTSDIWNDAINPTPVSNPENISNFRKIEMFKTINAKFRGVCKSCNKTYNTGEVVAEVKGIGATHHRCRTFWIKK